MTAGDGNFTRDSLARDAEARAAITRLQWAARLEPEGWSAAEVSIASVAARGITDTDRAISAVNLQLRLQARFCWELGTASSGALAQRDVQNATRSPGWVVAALREELGREHRPHARRQRRVRTRQLDHEQTARWVFDAAAGLDVELRDTAATTPTPSR
ncbi:MAG: hypothetical protein H6674_11220 [Dehalococcoidia bacterium]|nr:hypothetical protein [Dehalococcoidia bacterium]